MFLFGTILRDFLLFCLLIQPVGLDLGQNTFIGESVILQAVLCLFTLRTLHISLVDDALGEGVGCIVRCCLTGTDYPDPCERSRRYRQRRNRGLHGLKGQVIDGDLMKLIPKAAFYGTYVLSAFFHLHNGHIRLKSAAALSFPGRTQLRTFCPRCRLRCEGISCPVTAKAGFLCLCT